MDDRQDTSTSRQRPWTRWSGDLTGAFADLGTFLPLVVGVLLVGGLAATPVLMGFFVFAVATGLLYRCPIPVQPMKAIAAMIISGTITASVVPIVSLLVAVVLIVAAITGWIDRLAHIVPRSILLGIQLALGLSLIANAGAMVPPSQLALAIALLAAVLALGLSRYGGLGCMALVGGGVLWGVVVSEPHATVGPAVSQAIEIGRSAVTTNPWLNVASATLAQLAMTLTNAVLLTAVLASEYFREHRERTTPRRLALSTGILNLGLAPFGALPMCHGAGGIAVQHAQGARTGLAPVLFGSACLALALGAGDRALDFLQLIPMPVVAALLAYAGTQLIDFRRLKGVRADCVGVIALTVLVSLTLNYALGLLAGLAAEHIRSRIAASRFPLP